VDRVSAPGCRRRCARARSESGSPLAPHLAPQLTLTRLRPSQVAHGDIKTENILVTSWNWVYLTDFASFKPVYLPLDDPSTFSYFFDTSSRRPCYLAPERFYAPDSDIARRKADLEFGKRDGRPTEAMDVFALGCVLAELWMEGTPPFSLSQLFKYREGEYSPETYLAEIEDIQVRVSTILSLRIPRNVMLTNMSFIQDLIRSMISLDPNARLSCAEYLQKARGSCFPEVFYTFLHPFLLSLNEQALAPTTQVVPSTPSSVGAGSTGPTNRPSIATVAPTPEPQALLRTDADDKIERVWTEWEMIAGYLDEGHHPKEDRRPEVAETSKAGRGEGVFPIRLHVPGLEGEAPQAGATEGEQAQTWTSSKLSAEILRMGCRRPCADAPLVAVRQHPQLPPAGLDPPRAGCPACPERVPHRPDQTRQARAVFDRGPAGR